MQAVWLSIQRNHPFAYERLFLWRLMHRGCHHSSDVSPLASSDTSHMQCRHDSQSHKGTDPGYISYTSDTGKTYDFNTADKLNTLLLNCLLSTGQLKEGEGYDVDFDHQFIEAEKYDAKPTYKKFLGYRPGVAVIGDLIVGIENSDGNTNVRFHQKNTLKRFFERFEQNKLIINRFRADCGSCSEEIVEEIAKHCKTFYIRANRCSSLYNDIFALRGWKKVKLGGIEFELASILIEKWKGKAYRLVIQRQKRIDGELDLWEGEYTYRCILTNDYESSEKEIVEFYNLRGGKD